MKLILGRVKLILGKVCRKVSIRAGRAYKIFLHLMDGDVGKVMLEEVDETIDYSEIIRSLLLDPEAVTVWRRPWSLISLPTGWQLSLP